MGGAIRVLHVEDEVGLQEVLEAHFESLETEIVLETADDGREGLQLVREEDFDCVISDYNMPFMDGVEMFNSIREEGITVPFIFYTSSKTIEEQLNDTMMDPPEEVILKGADDFGDIVDAVVSVRTEAELSSF